MPSYRFMSGQVDGGLRAEAQGRGIHTPNLRQEAFDFGL
jgi:hypothetical protein